MKKKRVSKIYASAALLSSLFMYPMLTNAQETQTVDTLTQSVLKVQSDVEALSKFKFAGYVQAQYQKADSAGINSVAGGSFPGSVESRFKVRRAEFKTMYDNGLTQVVANINVTQEGGGAVSIKDAYGKFTEPWFKIFSVTGGIFNRPFGFENGYSSGMLETPERARIIQTLLPGERDLGGMITFQMPKGTLLDALKIEGGAFNGTGNSANDFDFRKDFIGRMRWDKTAFAEKIKYGVGVSYYDGGWKRGNASSYTMGTDSAGISTFKLSKDTMNSMTIAKRQYMGGDFQVSIDLPIGMTTIRGEYIEGQQPGVSNSSISPAAQPTTDTYIRRFNGGYLCLIQAIWRTKHQLVVKYDWYDPNTAVALNNIGVSTSKGFAKTNGQDLRYTTIGIGWTYKLDANVKIIAYYDMVTNEASKSLDKWTRDLKDNVLTFRVQYKF